MPKIFSFEKLKNILVEKNLTVSNFSKLTNIPRVSIYSWQKYQKIRIPKHRKALEEVLGCKYLDLCVEGERVKTGNTNKLQPAEYDKLPLVGRVDSILWIDLASHPVTLMKNIYINSVGSASKFAVTLHNDSMQPTFLEGDTIIIDQQMPFTDGCFALIAWKNGDMVLSDFRRVFRIGDGYVCKPSNPIYPDMIIKQQDVIKIAKAIEVIHTLL